MQVILTDDVFELGKRGEIVKVADGYGRNYLIPRRLAIPVTPGNIKMMEQQKLVLAKKEAKFRDQAELLAAELNQLHLIVSRKAGDTGALFGSVTTKDLVELLNTQGVHIDRRKIMMDQPLKVIGNYRLEVRPHSDVEANLLLSILVEGDTPVARVKKKDPETDRIVADLDAKVKEIAQLTGRRPVEAPSAPPPDEARPKRKARREEGENTESEAPAE
jgi:large subunit ribosomal protein L9